MNDESVTEVSMTDEDPKKPASDPQEPEDEGDSEEDGEDREDGMLPLPPPPAPDLPLPNYLGQIEKQYMKVGGHGVVNAFQWQPDADGVLPEWYRQMEPRPAVGDWVVRHADAVSIVKPADFDRDYEARS